MYITINIMLDNFISEPFLGFSKESLSFLSKLKNKKYNNKDWFDKNRDTYEDFLKIPMRALLDSITNELKRIDSRIVISYKSIFRINRDIRFKNDKTPYKFNYSAAFSYDKIKTPEIPQFYFHLSPDEFLFASGQYSTDNNIIKKIRSRISRENNLYLEIVNDKLLRDTFGEINGEKLINVPKEYRNEIIDKELGEYLRMKQYYVFKNYKPEIALTDGLAELIINNVRITNNFNKFLFDSLK